MINFKFFKGHTHDRDNILWKTSTGRQTPISWMTSNHIKNCLNCLRGTGDSRIPDPYLGRFKEEWINIFQTELRLRENSN